MRLIPPAPPAPPCRLVAFPYQTAACMRANEIALKKWRLRAELHVVVWKDRMNRPTAQGAGGLS